MVASVARGVSPKAGTLGVQRSEHISVSGAWFRVHSGAKHSDAIGVQAREIEKEPVNAAIYLGPQVKYTRQGMHAQGCIGGGVLARATKGLHEAAALVGVLERDCAHVLIIIIHVDRVCVLACNVSNVSTT